MNDLRKAAQQALDALVSQFDGRADAIYILSAALAEPVQEPVAWMFVDDTGMRFVSVERPHKDFQPLYATPPQRKPLPEEEIYAAIKGIDSLKAVEAARAIERAHGIE